MPFLHFDRSICWIEMGEMQQNDSAGVGCGPTKEMINPD